MSAVRPHLSDRDYCDIRVCPLRNGFYRISFALYEGIRCRIGHLLYWCDRHGDMQPRATHITHTHTSYHVAAVRKFDTVCHFSLLSRQSERSRMFLLSPLYIKLWAAVSVRGILSFQKRNLLYDSKWNFRGKELLGFGMCWELQRPYRKDTTISDFI